MSKPEIDIPYLSKLYDDLYEQADSLIREVNPCNIKGTGIFYSDEIAKDPNKTLREYSEWEIKTCTRLPTIDRARGALCCCNGCKYISQNGCTVRSLLCKIWICNSVYTAYPDLAKKLSKIRCVGMRYNLLWCRESKEYVFSQLSGVKE